MKEVTAKVRRAPAGASGPRRRARFVYLNVEVQIRYVSTLNRIRIILLYMSSFIVLFPVLKSNVEK